MLNMATKCVYNLKTYLLYAIVEYSTGLRTLYNFLKRNTLINSQRNIIMIFLKLFKFILSM